MASVEFIEKRLDGAKANLVKLEKKLERVLKAEESNYEKNNPYYYSEYDKRCTLRDIEETKRNIEKYEQQLQTTIEKDNSRNVQVIIDFLDEWKKRVYEFYDSNLQEYYQERETLTNLYRSMSQFNYGTPEYNASREVYEAARLALYRKTNGVFEVREVMNPWNKRMEKVSVKVSEGRWEFLKHYIDRGSKEDAYEKLEKDLEAERKRKYDFIIERTNKIVGEITDAAGLTITAGELNGIIIGTKGKARVKTIGCGGYNTDVIVNVKHGQVYHFRTLIDEVK